MKEHDFIQSLLVTQQELDTPATVQGFKKYLIRQTMENLPEAVAASHRIDIAVNCDPEPRGTRMYDLYRIGSLPAGTADGSTNLLLCYNF